MASTSKVNIDIPVVGIDLGTTYSCLGIWRFGKVEIVANDFGYRITPSIVSFDDHVRLLGDAAKQQCYDNVENTVYDAKRLIGRTFDDPEVQKDMQNWPFTVRKGANGLPKIHVTFQGVKEILSPEEISSMILSKMKHIAEDFLGVPVKSAVITVPAYFNDQQRQATKDAAEIADLEVLRILNEPTAAALAYGFGNGLVMDKNILVFDLGGGTFDVSILNIKNTKFKVLATGGNTHLGGEDFDNCMVNHFLTEINRKMHKDIRGNKRALVKLRRACELAKRTLSLQTMATLHVELLVDGIDFRSTITRARFEELCNELFRSTLIIVVDALKGAKMVKSQIDEIVMVGGSTRIPKIQNLVKNFFEGKEPTKSINPDEAVAYGACLAAAILHGAGPNRELSMDLTDVLPLSLGVGCEKDFGEMGFVLARNTEIPVSHSEIFMTLEDNQTEINFKVFQGEHNLTKSNILLGEFELRNIPKNRAEEEKAIVTFTVNANGILNVTAQLMSTKKSAQIVVDTKGKLSKKEIEQMVLNAQMMNEKDRERKSLDQSKNKLEQLCWNLKEVFSDESNTSDIPATELTYILQKCDVTLNWLQSNAQFSDNEAITQQTSKMNALVDRWLPNVGDSFSQTH